VFTDPRVYRTTFSGEGDGISQRCETGWFSKCNDIADWQVGKKYTYLVRSFPINGGSNIELHINKPENGNRFIHFGTFWEKSKTPG